MLKTITTILITLFVLSGCATWKGVKKDSSDAWDATKKTSKKAWSATKEGASEAYDSTKEAIHEATADKEGGN
ncbi:hypothetical protein [Arcobacter arenosus]|uniref:Lipoprotein n=1 Tax=Arcobacter arenosus TaxID=2576037 RepID=A0A5R8XXC8_9BACT|nr:hypothetical protein [Arcobacter arenosus]TLP35819.1 hypothetical protein FDK22_14275 [Arcobacter arenosus]